MGDCTASGSFGVAFELCDLGGLRSDVVIVVGQFREQMRDSAKFFGVDVLGEPCFVVRFFWCFGLNGGVRFGMGVGPDKVLVGCGGRCVVWDDVWLYGLLRVRSLVVLWGCGGCCGEY